LPQGKLGLDQVPRSALVRTRGRPGRHSSPRSRRPALRRDGGRPEPDEAPPARGLAGAPPRRPAPSGLPPRRESVPRRARRGSRRRVAPRRDRRGAREGTEMKYVGIALVHAWRWTFGLLLTPPGTCKYHPSCSQYAIDALREFGFVRGTVLAGW